MLCIPVSLKASGIAEMIREIPADHKTDLFSFAGCKLTAAAKCGIAPVFLSVFIRKNSFYLTNARNDKLPFHFRLRQQLFVKVVHSFIRMSDACDLQKLFKNRIQLLLIHQGNFFFRQLCAKLRQCLCPEVCQLSGILKIKQIGFLRHAEHAVHDIIGKIRCKFP